MILGSEYLEADVVTQTHDNSVAGVSAIADILQL